MTATLHQLRAARRPITTAERLHAARMDEERAAWEAAMLADLFLQSEAPFIHIEDPDMAEPDATPKPRNTKAAPIVTLQGKAEARAAAEAEQERHEGLITIVLLVLAVLWVIAMCCIVALKVFTSLLGAAATPATIAAIASIGG
jgi:hypothetical protein